MRSRRAAPGVQRSCDRARYTRPGCNRHATRRSHGSPACIRARPCINSRRSFFNGSGAAACAGVLDAALEQLAAPPRSCAAPAAITVCRTGAHVTTAAVCCTQEEITWSTGNQAWAPQAWRGGKLPVISVRWPVAGARDRPLGARVSLGCSALAGTRPARGAGGGLHRTILGRLASKDSRSCIRPSASRSSILTQRPDRRSDIQKACYAARGATTAPLGNRWSATFFTIRPRLNGLTTKSAAPALRLSINTCLSPCPVSMMMGIDV